MEILQIWRSLAVEARLKNPNDHAEPTQSNAKLADH